MFFSVIIPTRDRPELLEFCLVALNAQTFSKDRFEVIVVDDGSSVPIGPVVERHSRTLPIRLLRQQNRGPAAARNQGLHAAAGTYVVFTDDDCRPEPEWLSAYEAAFAQAPGAGLGGEVKPAPENGICGNTSQLLVSYLYNHNDTRTPFFCTNNVAFPRQLLLDLGGFDETFPLAAAEDRDICSRWNQRHPLRHAPAAAVLHRQALDFRGYVRQHFRYGRGAYQFHTRRKLRGDRGIRVESIRFYSRMLLFPWNVYPAGVAALQSSLLVLAQVANVAGYVYERYSES